MEGKPPWPAFFYGYLTGALFFFGTLWWFIHVTLPGMILLNLYLALYFGFFGAGFAYFSRLDLMPRLAVIPALWVALEYFRAHLLTGFGWVALGHSQYRTLWFVQIAEVTSVYGISFLVVMVNALLEEWLVRFFPRWEKPSRSLARATIIAALVLAVAGGFGLWRLNSGRTSVGRAIRIGVVQGNIPLSERGSAPYWPRIWERYFFLTEQVAAQRPDLVIWPETAFPGFVWEEEKSLRRLKTFLLERNTTLLLGMVTRRGQDNFFNSAVLLDSRGRTIGQYDKLHLVPFGEYIPFRKEIPFLSNVVPIDDFTAGAYGPPLNLPVSPRSAGPEAIRFGVLICFEDTISTIARHFVQQGAEFLVNITNDAWFQDSAASFLHLQAAVFRSLEHRRSLVRAANTGLSCLIDPSGRIVKSVEGPGKIKNNVAGQEVFDVPLNSGTTFYTKFGDVFTYLCFGCILWKIAFGKKRSV